LYRSIKLLLLFFCPIGVAAQHAALITGRLQHVVTHQPLADLHVLVPKLQLLVATDENGYFELGPLDNGIYTLIFNYDSVPVDSVKIVVSGMPIDLGTIMLLPPARTENEAPYVSAEQMVSDNDLRDQEGQAPVTPILQASNRDPFSGTAGFVLGQYHFRPRGLGGQQIQINGISMNDLVTRAPGWTQWSGLNDVFRNSSATYGLTPAEYSFGGVSGSRTYDVRAALQGRQSRLTYSISDRNYSNRIMLSHSSGVSPRGWAYALAVSRSWANEGYIPGTFLNSYSYYAAAGKYLQNGALLSITLIGSNSERGKASAATDELFLLSGSHYYNPGWGYQNGVKRNARIGRQHVPMLLFSYDHQRSERIQWKLNLGIQAGNISNTALDWYKGPDPRADYYRNLPSYFAATDPATAAALTDAINADPGKLQLDWNRLYAANYSNYEWLNNANGQPGNNIYGRRSVYVIGSDVEQLRRLTLSSSLHQRIGKHLSLNTGLQARVQRSIYFRELTDLLGGDYFLNNNMFAEQQFAAMPSFAQNDLNTPDRAIRQGDKYHYYYSYLLTEVAAWSQLQADFRRLNVFAAANATYLQYQRNGFYRNGLYTDDSYGKTILQIPLNYAGKAGVNYKLNGRNFLFLNGYIALEDPGINNHFISPRTRGQFLDQVPLQMTQSLECGYLMKAPRLNLRAVGYVTDQHNGTDIRRFYNDDPAYQTFVNYVMQGLDMRFTGAELAAAWQLHPSLSLSAVTALGQAFYTRNPRIRVFADNDTDTHPGQRNVFIKNYSLASGPQSACSFGAAYNSSRHWYARINTSYLANNYVAINPDRRTYEAAGLTPPGSPQYQSIYRQEMLSPFFVVDFAAGKSLRLRKLSKTIAYNWMLNCNLSIGNVLDNRNIKTGGYEQLRYDYTGNNPDKFQSKYFYGYGRTFSLSLSLKY